MAQMIATRIRALKETMTAVSWFLAASQWSDTAVIWPNHGEASRIQRGRAAAGKTVGSGL